MIVQRKEIWGMGNRYGGLHVREKDGKFWGIVSDEVSSEHSSDASSDHWDWEEIPFYLYDALLKYDRARQLKYEQERPKK